MSDTHVQDAVREKYGDIARSVGKTGVAARRRAAAAIRSPPTSIRTPRPAGLPADAVAASLGCGNPTALARPRSPARPCSISGRAAASTCCSPRSASARPARSYGLDMTDEMLALARENQRKAGATNVEFLKGTIEAIPLPDNSVDVIISNCVINLSSDKDAVLREAFRVLKPGGRFAVSDVVVRGEVPAEIRRSMELWVGCVAGALEEDEYAAKLKAAGFVGRRGRAVARLPGRRRARVSHRERARRRRDRAAGRRQVRQRVHPRAQAGGARRAADRPAARRVQCGIGDRRQLSRGKKQAGERCPGDFEIVLAL